MTGQSPDRPTDAEATLGRRPQPPGRPSWPGPDWVESQELWPLPDAPREAAPSGEPDDAQDSYQVAEGESGARWPQDPLWPAQDPQWPQDPPWPAPDWPWPEHDLWRPQDGHTAHEERPGDAAAAWHSPGASPGVEDYSPAPDPQEGGPASQDYPFPGPQDGGPATRDHPFRDSPAGGLPSQDYPGQHHPFEEPPASSQAGGGSGESAVATALPPASRRPAALSPAAGDLRWAMIGYLTVPFFCFLVPLVLYLGSRRSLRCRAHAAQAVNAALTGLMYDLSAAIMAAVLVLDSPVVAVAVAAPMVSGLWVISLVYLVRAASAAGRGEYFRLPDWLCAPLVKLDRPRLSR